MVILLEPPGHSYYDIEINPAGKVFDADRAGGGQVTARWESMTEVKVERGKDYWRVEARIPIAVVGREGAEMDPFNYVVGPELGAGSQWRFNIGRRRPRGGKRTASEYVFSPTRKYTFHAPAKFARLIME